MKDFNQEEFNKFVIEQDVIGFFGEPIELKSGRFSNWYINWRNVAEDVYLFDELLGYIFSFVKDLNLTPDCFFGVPEGATKLGVVTQYMWVKSRRAKGLWPWWGPGVYSLPMGRGKPKSHGDPKDRYFLGMPKGKTIILEDVTTTGESLLAAIDRLLEAKAQVIAVIGLTNRNEIRDDGKSVKEAVEDKGISYYVMSNALDLLPLAYKKLQPGETAAQLVEEYFERYGISKIKLR